MFNVPKLSAILWKSKKCPICRQSLVETPLKEQKYTCRVSCPACKISHDGYHFYDCYDSFFNSVLNRMRMKFSKARKTEEKSHYHQH